MANSVIKANIGAVLNSYEGDIVIIKSPIERPFIMNMQADINPIQDLHGYDKPWVGGNGKNLNALPYYQVPPQGNTINGIKYTANADGSVTLKGTATAGSEAQLHGRLNTDTFKALWLPNGTYKASINNDVVYYQIATTYNNAFRSVLGYGRGERTFTIDDNFQTDFVDANGRKLIAFYVGGIANGQQVDEIIYPVICKSTESSAWSPWENICPISGWTECEIPRIGKNFFDKTATDTTKGYVANKYLESSGAETTYTGVYNISEYIRVNPSAVYAISGMTGGSPSLCFYDAFKNYISGEKYNSRSSFTIASPSNAKYVRISIPVSNIDSVQFENNSATSYEPYNGNTFTIDLDGTRYGGTIDVTSGVMNVTHGIKKCSGASLQGSVNNSYYAFNVSDRPSDMVQTNYPTPAWCDMYDYVTSGSDRNNGTCYILQGNIIFVSDAFTNLTNANSLLTSQQPTVIYPLATPLTVQLTPTQIEALVGENNIWCSTGQTKLTALEMESIS